MGEKRCPDCKSTKPLSEFFKNRSHKDGVDDYCKRCKTVRLKAWTKTTAGKKWLRKYHSTPARKAYLAREQVKYRHRNPEAIRARTALNHAVQRGKLKRGNCWCGEKAEAHIPDFSKPLEVVWLCPAHNRGAAHGALGNTKKSLAEIHGYDPEKKCWCPVCKTVKLLQHFWRWNVWISSGRPCKICAKARQKRYLSAAKTRRAVAGG